jgi:hypothetical protein
MTNATQDASMSSKDNVIIKLIDLSEKQNELIFSTRKRLFKLERTQNKDARILCGMSIGICVILILMCLEFGGFKW